MSIRRPLFRSSLRFVSSRSLIERPTIHTCNTSTARSPDLSLLLFSRPLSLSLSSDVPSGKYGFACGKALILTRGAHYIKCHDHSHDRSVPIERDPFGALRITTCCYNGRQAEREDPIWRRTSSRRVTRQQRHPSPLQSRLAFSRQGAWPCCSLHFISNRISVTSRSRRATCCKCGRTTS